MTALKKIADYIVNNDIEHAYNTIINIESDYWNNADYWNLRGVLCLKIGEYKAAIGCLEKALSIDPKNGDIYFNYAYALENIGNNSDASLYFGFSYRYSKDSDLKDDILSKYEHQEALKNIFITAASEIRKSFIILSSCGWGDIYQRMHHIAHSLAKLGHDVYYVSPSTIINVDNSENISSLVLTNHSFKNMKMVDGVKIYTPISAICGQRMVCNNYIDVVQRLVDTVTQTEKIVLTYMPYQVNVINSLKGDFFHIYECVDDHSDLEYAFWGNKHDIIWEQELMDRADAITTTATSLFLQRVSIEERKNVYLSRNAVNERDFIFTNNEHIPDDLKHIPEPRIVYSGAIYEWFDMELFYEIVNSNPDKSFVIIGFGKNELFKENCPNLYFLGTKKHSDLKNYLRHMQIGIIPFKENTDIIINCDPIKQYEYIACNIPVITTFMPESALGKINTILANHKDSFNKAIQKCLSLKLDDHLISDYLSENSWNERAALLCRISDNLISIQEKDATLSGIGESLEYLVNHYDSPIFITLKAVFDNLKNNMDFESFARKAYDIEKLKYIEKQYLFSLIRNNNISTFVEVVRKSVYIKNEIKQELLYRIKTNELDNIKAISYLCVGDVKTFLELIARLPDKHNILLYDAYINYMLNGSVNVEVMHHHAGLIDSPLYIFLMKFNN
ncbi:tetratricopeptide repeat protein [Robertmurraya kyonggiensis]|uniref:Tetratricopeptide repeat protein n=1 Tax=Robertmurraya kyonggiensis TaxID=1037680 RepID=A0A4V5P1N6_9BACI|nr:glycosyltransferase [Robertmurraya kyonggiensis]TKC17040.1 tetratricopeptide repeat protein [Robertmurraya kyonggiensis]